MRAMTRAEVRSAIVNLDPTQKKVHLPVWFDEVQWHRIDYLGWRDLRAPMRVYLVADVDDRATGILLRQHPNQGDLGSRAMMCDLCRFSRRFNEVSLFTAQRPSRDKRQRLSTVGLHLCTDLDCSANVQSKPIVGPFAPPVEETIGRRREGLRERTTTFLRSVTDRGRIA
ncbi:FBP domain-containing protein [Nocardia cyriacigeorgica]|uniref:FBP domain-containing protein n=2 Tax=Nocardia cyriacigeorgica TaxID=135487 RepID=UPI001895CD33|nr:FBP domain-containing protein [Nocardia cyriacigeorgica]MBF6160586.1 FBP domain-containing protein [Nocardia cyriacigeorgica]MBF6199647.1 FBP domain-containing protein [Nocardia cyriacigeorgica]MBF6320053.1 FBP domain-containing protein [Nocardia cyriacigeorgica]MBF6534471.1 FBP domain-containing protein [Nocardia cyriacigeorgica]